MAVAIKATMATSCIPSRVKKKSFILIVSGSPDSSRKAIVKLGVNKNKLIMLMMTAATESVFPLCDARMAKKPDSPIKSVPKIGMKILTTDSISATMPNDFILKPFSLNLAHNIFISNFI